MRISDWSSDVCSSDLLEVQEGDQVKRGDALISGSPNPHDILDGMDDEALAEYLVAEIQEDYRLQAVKLNATPSEVIVRQMLQQVEDTNGGDATLMQEVGRGAVR